MLLLNTLTYGSLQNMAPHVQYFKHQQFLGAGGCQAEDTDSPAGAVSTRQCLCVKINGERLVQTLSPSRTEHHEDQGTAHAWGCIGVAGVQSGSVPLRLPHL